MAGFLQVLDMATSVSDQAELLRVSVSYIYEALSEGLKYGESLSRDDLHLNMQIVEQALVTLNISTDTRLPIEI